MIVPVMKLAGRAVLPRAMAMVCEEREARNWVDVAMAIALQHTA
jgi:hypothetical protein